jgi:regulation of enolase protein 1 (concanavalin A-like superfamily)
MISRDRKAHNVIRDTQGDFIFLMKITHQYKHLQNNNITIVVEYDNVNQIHKSFFASSKDHKKAEKKSFCYK